MGRFHYFDRWTEEQRQKCHQLCKVQEFRKDQIIFAEGRTPINYAHFVLSGQCAVLQCLKMVKSIDKYGLHRYRLSDAQPIEDELTQIHRRRSSRMIDLEQSTLMMDGNLTFPSKTVTADNCLTVESTPPPKRETLRPLVYEYRFIDIATYSCGSVFGIGEHMQDRTVVARSRSVQCLLIPRYWLLQKSQNVNNVWNRIRVFLDQRQLTRDGRFRWYLKELQWRKIRNQVRENFLTNHVEFNHTKLCDVPSMCRIEQSDVFV
ncbi:uncharacterized protein LOC129749217 [Uranotaenia lowii]|uniref:uncharacterized protein LOC129749217 n=1 Tax=Uranotaenia lowii TaxID=190385 RepID=UPI0024795760|nr:uncharacterized protein LOC129749217 [Uranotaenia lowii]